jgi:magnesium transporter
MKKRNPSPATRIASHHGRRGQARTRKEPALPPGSLIHVGDRKAESFQLNVITYDRDHVEEQQSASIDESVLENYGTGIQWIHASGLHDVEKIAALTSRFKIHSLTVEDVLNTHHRGKIELLDESIFVVSKTAEMQADRHVGIQHFCLILTGKAVLSFGEAPTTIFEPLLRRIREGSGRIRKMGTDYLAWALLDAIVDHYFGVIDEVEEQLLHLDELLQKDITAVNALELYGVKNEITHLHRLVRPLREIANSLQHTDCPQLTGATQIFFRDLHDHTAHLVEQTEELRELASNLRDFYITSVSNRMNEVMKVLTCVATIFLPLSFLAGVYGMNFAHMPELSFSWGYPAIWLIFLVIGGGMLWLFIAKKWL